VLNGIVICPHRTTTKMKGKLRVNRRTDHTCVKRVNRLNLNFAIPMIGYSVEGRFPFHTCHYRADVGWFRGGFPLPQTNLAIFKHNTCNGQGGAPDHLG